MCINYLKTLESQTEAFKETAKVCDLSSLSLKSIVNILLF